MAESATTTATPASSAQSPSSAESATSTKTAKPPRGLRENLREIAETLVFVVTLVLMLKLFVVEAFVIPTGSMAETLYGYHKTVTCPECGFQFPVNASNEFDPSDGPSVPVIGACCPNCRHRFDWQPGSPEAPPYQSGDRVLVHKVLYHLAPPQPGDVVVFKYPVDPQVRHSAQNYIKRLWGRGGETIAIHRGDLYRSRALDYADFPRPEDASLLWIGPEVDFHSKTRFRSMGNDFTYHNAGLAIQLFDESWKSGFESADDGYELIRKSDDLVLAMRSIVYNNNFQSESLAKRGVPPRWQPESGGWDLDNARQPREFRHVGDDLSWVRYKHLVPTSRNEWDRLISGELKQPEPKPITNFLGYNAGIESGRGEFRNISSDFWVGDLILECDAEFSSSSDTAVLELSKGEHRYQAQFQNGQVTLVRTGPSGREMATAATGISTGSYSLRFANVDCRLRVWVNGRSIDFGDAANYPPDPIPESFDPNDRNEEGWTTRNDIAAPASVGAKGNVSIRNLVLWRDSYFTNSDGSVPAEGVAKYVDTYYVQPGHYLCLGDNSAQSSDSRKWGTVPERLLLGKAVFVFLPFNRIGPIQ